MTTLQPLFRVLSFFFLGLALTAFILYNVSRGNLPKALAPHASASSTPIAPTATSGPPVHIADITVETVHSARITISPVTCGMFAAVACARQLGVPVDLPTVWQKAKWTPQGLSMLELKSLCEHEFGLKADGVRYSPADSLPSAVPAILWVRGGDVPSFEQPHYLVYLGLARFNSTKIVYFDPSTGINIISRADLSRIWSGECLLLARP